jgi:hypothetical protein
MNPVKKDFDCVEFKRNAQEAIYEKIRNLKPEEEIAFFRDAARQGPLGQWWADVQQRAREGEDSPRSTQ